MPRTPGKSNEGGATRDTQSSRDKSKARDFEERKPFVGVSRRNTYFGNAPLLPGQKPGKWDTLPADKRSTPKAKKAGDGDQRRGKQQRQPPLSPASMQKQREAEENVAQQSLRWHHLSRTLWVMLVYENSPQADAHAVDGFLDVLSWRIQGDITEQEFTELYKHWVQHGEGAEPPEHTPGSPPMNSPKSFRVMLVKRGQTEPDLDLMLSMLINEQNRELLQPAQGLFGAANAICNHRWLLSSEKLFFMMDADGRGCVAFDELQWLALATLNARGDDSISPVSLTSVTYDLLDSMMGTARGGETAKLGSGLQMATLPMFKRYLVQSACGEGVVATSIELLSATTTDGRPGKATSLPRLWEEAIKDVVGEASIRSASASNQLLTFLMVDAPTSLQREWLEGRMSVEEAAVELWEGLQLAISASSNMNVDHGLLMRDPIFSIIFRVLSRYSVLRSQMLDTVLGVMNAAGSGDYNPSELLPLLQVPAASANAGGVPGMDGFGANAAASMPGGAPSSPNTAIDPAWEAAQRSLQPDLSTSWELAQQSMQPPAMMPDASAANGTPGNPMSPIAMNGSGVYGSSPAQAWGPKSASNGGVVGAANGSENGYANGFADGAGQSQAHMYSPDAHSLNGSGMGAQMYNGNMSQPFSGYSPSPNQPPSYQQQPLPPPPPPQQQQPAGAGPGADQWGTASQHAIIEVPDAVLQAAMPSQWSPGELARMVEEAVWEDVIAIPEQQQGSAIQSRTPISPGADRERLAGQGAGAGAGGPDAITQSGEELASLVDRLLSVGEDERGDVLLQLQRARAGPANGTGDSGPSTAIDAPGDMYGAGEGSDILHTMGDDATMQARELREALRSLTSGGQEMSNGNIDKIVETLSRAGALSPAQEDEINRNMSSQQDAAQRAQRTKPRSVKKSPSRAARAQVRRDAERSASGVKALRRDKPATASPSPFSPRTVSRATMRDTGVPGHHPGEAPSVGKKPKMVFGRRMSEDGTR